MKKTILYIALAAVTAGFVSCDLDKYPETSYSEHNAPDSGEGETAVSNREQLKAQLDAMYEFMKDGMQTYWYQMMTYADARTDNAYGGNMGEAKVVAVESNHIDSDNEFPLTFWNGSMNAVDKANQVICNIDRIKETDPSLSEQEYKEWRSEALCLRAYIWMNMMQLFGDIPMVTAIPPAITSDNIEEVYPLYFPKRVEKSLIGEQIVKDIEEFACLNAPNPDPANKFRFNKGFANGLMARYYAMKEFRNWEKVKTFCEKVEGMNFKLCDSFGDLWAYDADKKTVSLNTPESIFEVNWGTNPETGAWIYMMFHRNAFNKMANWEWAKWCTPSRNLIAAYDKLGDKERKNLSIVFDKCTWAFHYPADNYAFMHKLPTNLSPVYLMRLADIKLLHAEALANLGDASGAATLVDQIRKRAKVAAVSDDLRSNAQLMREVVLEERRLELAFEGHRWFDLIRYGEDLTKLFEVSDGVNINGSASFDSYFQPRKQMDAQHVILPIPTSVLDVNSNLTQNQGY